MSEIKNCPFCGTVPEVSSFVRDDGGDHRRVQCQNHSSCGMSYMNFMDVADWNRRAAPAIPASVVEEYKRLREIERDGHDAAQRAAMMIIWTVQKMGYDLRELEAK